MAVAVTTRIGAETGATIGAKLSSERRSVLMMVVVVSKQPTNRQSGTP